MARRSTAVIATLGISALAFALPSLLRRRKSKLSEAEEDAFYAKQVTPSWAPPAWAFPVAWSLNTLALAAATQHLAFRQNHPRRTELLTYLGLHWLLYISFSRVYFDEKSQC